MHAKVKLYAAIIIVLAVLVPLVILAGNTGKIRGKVVDKATGDPIPNASVQIEGTKMGATTDPDGLFLIMRVPEGLHQLRVSATGYHTYLIDSISVAADITTGKIVIRLEPYKDYLDKLIKLCSKKDREGRFEISSEPLMGAEEIKYMPVPTPEKRKVDYCLMMVPRCAAEQSAYYPPAHGGTAIVNGQAYDAMFFENYGVNPFVDTEDDHLSTFAIDVDDASYIMARSYLERGTLPPKDAIRVEEFVNHFDYGYDAPGESPFEVYIEGAPSKFGKNCELLRFGIKGKKIRSENRKAANLVFVIDVSGSMGREDRLGLVRKALRMLVNELTIRDKVGIVIYGSRGQVILNPTSIDHKDEILNAIEQLYPSGSTNAEEGLRLGYRMAEQMFDKSRINRIILCSDGVANVGRTGAEDILKWIKDFADKGITLSSIGFGMGNYNDILLEKLGDKGNGHYAYVDDIAEARRIFVENLTGTLQVIARDVKIQVDFDPEVVRSYRLLGYENRDVDDDKFRDDKEDGGEIGSGHSVTALYEIKFQDNVDKDKLGTIFIRHKDPDSDEVTEISRDIRRGMFHEHFTDASNSFKLAAAAAEFSEILRKSYWAKDSSLDKVLDLAREVYNADNENADILELLNLITKAKQFEEQLADG